MLSCYRATYHLFMMLYVRLSHSGLVSSTGLTGNTCSILRRLGFIHSFNYLFVLVFPIKSLSALAVWICVPYFMFYVMFISKHQHFQKAEILGDCSYCMYLIGFPIQQSIVYVMGGGPINPFINIIIAVVIDIAIALLMHIFIECRVDRLTKRY